MAGFRPKTSKLDVKKQIADGVDGYSRIILAFGQVDLELKYLYRLVEKGESLTPASYTLWLVGLYENFLEELVPSGKDIALKGVNLTALSPAICNEVRLPNHNGTAEFV